MIQDRQTHLMAEKAAVESLLDRTPQDAVLDRKSLESRIRSIDHELARLDTEPALPARARLTFRGRPVVGSRGIFADFAAKATGTFNDLVTVVLAGASGPLSESGPISSRGEGQLMITGTATGSFGFEIAEQVSQHRLSFDASPITTALHATMELLAGTKGSDDAVTELVAEADKRVLNALRKFLDVLVSSDAVCSLNFGDGGMRFSDVDEVRRALDRLSDDNVHEETQKFFGSFVGILPQLRTFEFRVTKDETIIRGKIGPEIESPDELNRHLQKPTDVSFVATRVGTGKTRFVLRTMPRWENT